MAKKNPDLRELLTAEQEAFLTEEKSATAATTATTASPPAASITVVPPMATLVDLHSQIPSPLADRLLLAVTDRKIKRQPCSLKKDIVTVALDLYLTAHGY